MRFHVFLNLVGTCGPVVCWRVNLFSLHALNMGKNEEKNLSGGSGVQPPSLKFCKVLSTKQHIFFFFLAFFDWLPRWLRGKNLPVNTGKVGLIPELGRSPGGGNGYPLQYSCLENPMDRGAWRATAHGVSESDTTEHTCMSSLMISQMWLKLLCTQGCYKAPPVTLCWVSPPVVGFLAASPVSLRKLTAYPWEVCKACSLCPSPLKDF